MEVLLPPNPVKDPPVAVLSVPPDVAAAVEALEVLVTRVGFCAPHG